MVDSKTKRALLSYGWNYNGYSEYTSDKSLEALQMILNNTDMQFNRNEFLKQILGIPMGGNASHFILDLHLSWFGNIAKDIYYNTLLLKGSTCGYREIAFLSVSFMAHFQMVSTMK